MTVRDVSRPPSLAGAEWLKDERLQKVLAALEAGGGTARIAGGAVRNALLGRAVPDIDIATTEAPDRVIVLAEARGLKVVTTGIEHGTVTVIANGEAARAFEVTTLRRDLETDGRHAKVAFTDDWHADASRRDLTINALYCDGEGAVFDPLGVLDDLARRRVRFVGRPQDRIAEDYLRILRFFRFHADYATGPIDPDGFDACARLRAGIARLSAERVWMELAKLLVTGGAAPVIAEMERSGVLGEILSGPRNVDRLVALAAIDEAHGLSADPVLRLAALALGQETDAAQLRDRLRLSNAETIRLAAIDDLIPRLSAKLGENDVKALCYRHGNERVADAARIAWADAGPDDAGWTAILALCANWTAPRFPLSGRDVTALGIPESEVVGAILSELEHRWIASGFALGDAALRDELRQCVARHSADR